MFGLLIGLGVVLILVILYLMFRLDVLVNIAKKKDDTTLGAENNFNATLLLILVLAGVAAFFWYSFTQVDRYTLPLASEHGKETDSLFNITMWITGFVFVVTNIVLFYFSFRYRYNKERKAVFLSHNNVLEIVWTVIPAIVLALLIGNGLMVWGDIMDEAPEDAEIVEIMGYQFAWDVRYSGNDNKFGAYDYKNIDDARGNKFGLDLKDENTYDDFSTNEIYLPVNKTVLMKIRARDVIHSFYLPHFRVKMDAVPGMVTQFKFTPTKTTEQMRNKLGNAEFDYELACAEICGRNHFAMRKIVKVVSQEEYEKWKTEQKTWLRLNSNYLSDVPADKREAAIVKSGITEEELKDL